MSPDFPDIPLARAIEHNAERYKQLATRLSDSIVGFQNWLTCLPGHFNERTSSGASEGNHKGKRLVIAVASAAGGKRQLNYAFVDDKETATAAAAAEPKGGWMPLTGASVEVKREAIALFPALLRRILMRQRLEVERLESATEAFDRFAERFGVTDAARA
jgi:hypothetical protein